MMEYISIALVFTIIGGGVTLATFARNKTKDDRSDGRQSGQMFAEMGYIKSGIDDIKTELREQRKINTEFATKLASVEASARQAHKRIDRIEGREYPVHEHERKE